jgi:putative methyltransferase (TIGR04325 family)
MHYLIKELCPPIVNTLRWYSLKYGWKGNYNSFEEAKAQCKGYDEDHILKRIVYTTTQVKNGDAVYERDGILYDKAEVNHNLLNALLLIAGRNGNKLTIIDFGGSLGTSYYQNIPYLAHLTTLNWCIIEQPQFVETGKQAFENEHVKFYYTLEECFAKHPQPDMLLISSALQYIPHPYDLLKKIQDYHIPYLMLDLVGYNDIDEDRVTIQHVPPVFYGVEASYPCLFFNRSKLETQLSGNYTKLFDFISEHQKYYINFKPFKYEGSFWQLKQE